MNAIPKAPPQKPVARNRSFIADQEFLPADLEILETRPRLSAWR